MTTRQAPLTAAQAMTLDTEHMMATYARMPVTFVRGKGTVLYDADGNEYLDFLAGLAVVSLGHAHPAVAAAIADQADTLVHVSNLYYNDVAPRLAARLDALVGGGGRVFLGNSGAEANECAIKLVRRHGQHHGGPERFHILSALGSFHGRTLATLAATGQPTMHEPFQPMPEGFRQVPFGDIDALAGALDQRVCAVLLEPMLGEGGVQELPEGYLETARALCDEREALLVLDEIQTGLGRTGAWFAFEHAGIRPDVITIAKALGNGMPIGACWARSDVAEVFVPGSHGSTFGGQPLSARAALAVLDVMEAEDVPARARAAGSRIATAVAGLDGVTDVRGRGLLLAAELAPGRQARAVAAASLHEGLVVNAVTPTAIRLAPPLLVTHDEIDTAVERLSRAITEVSS